MATKSMTIGKVAKLAGVNLETIRYYQRIGLVEQPMRPAGGIRQYDEHALERLRRIKRAQRLGFSLAEIRTLLESDPSRDCGETRTLAELKLQTIQSQLRSLARMEKTLMELIKSCAPERPSCSCPIIGVLHADEGHRTSM